MNERLDWESLGHSPDNKDRFLIVCSWEQWSHADDCVVDYTVYVDPNTKSLFAEKHLYDEIGNRVVWFSIGM